MNKKLSKEDVKSPDQVLKTLHQGFQWSQNHSMGVVAALVVFIVLGVGVSIYGSFADKKEAKAQEAYSQFEKNYLFSISRWIDSTTRWAIIRSVS